VDKPKKGKRKKEEDAEASTEDKPTKKKKT